MARELDFASGLDRPNRCDLLIVKVLHPVTSFCHKKKWKRGKNDDKRKMSSACNVTPDWPVPLEARAVAFDAPSGHLGRTHRQLVSLGSGPMMDINLVGISNPLIKGKKEYDEIYVYVSLQKIHTLCTFCELIELFSIIIFLKRSMTKYTKKYT